MTQQNLRPPSRPNVRPGPAARTSPTPGAAGDLTETRLFELHRDHDVSGVSGTGVVADGVVFPDGRVATRWRGAIAQTCSWDSIDDVLAVHGHGGATRVVWVDTGARAEVAALRSAVGALPGMFRLMAAERTKRGERSSDESIAESLALAGNCYRLAAREVERVLASVGSSGEPESPTRAGLLAAREALIAQGVPESDLLMPVGAPVSSGGQADREGWTANAILGDALTYYAQRRSMDNPKGWDHVLRKVEGAQGLYGSGPEFQRAREVLRQIVDAAARPVLSREAIRRETFAEVSRAMNRHADMWERDGSDPCRVRVERELANAYRAYAEGYGEPTGSRRDVLTAGGEQA